MATAEPTTDFAFDWTDLAFASKKPLKDLRATLMAAPREISLKRFKQLIKTYLPKGNIVLGVAKENYVEGFEDQPQFSMLTLADVQHVIEQVNSASPKYRIYTLEYFQRELPHVIDKIGFSQVILVNGSWRHVFHVSPAYYALVSRKIPYEMVSPFVDEQEARQYEKTTDEKIDHILDTSDLFRGHDSRYTELELMQMAGRCAKRSYDHSYQAGLVLAKQKPRSDTYTALTVAFNKVVPFQTYAMHYGPSREKNFSPPNDQNHYDTVHAEVSLMVKYINSLKPSGPAIHGSLQDTTLFINLMPCPTCARMLTQTDITEIVYSTDHSDGYAVKMLEAAGKTVRRLVP